MTRFRLSPEAAQDIIEIFEYLAQDSVEAAEQVRAEIYDTLVGLAAMPRKGHRREDLTSRPVLFWPVRSYQVIYRERSGLIEVIAVLHGERNIKRVLKQR